MLKLKSKFVFLGVVVFAAFMVFLAGLYIFHVIFKTEIMAIFLQFCIDLIRAGTEEKSVLEYLFITIIIYGLGSFVYRIAKQIILMVKVNQGLKIVEVISLSRFYQVTDRSKKEHIYVIDHQEPIALTMGYLRPRILLSRGLIETLDQDELEAVIHHEAFHQKHYDPLKVFIITLICDTFRFIPMMKGIASYYKIHRELLADQYSMAKMGSSTDLGSALLKLMKRDTPRIESIAAVSFADTALNYRMKQIINENSQIHVTFPFKGRKTALIIVMLFIFLSMTLSGCA